MVTKERSRTKIRHRLTQAPPTSVHSTTPLSTSQNSQLFAHVSDYRQIPRQVSEHQNTPVHK